MNNIYFSEIGIGSNNAFFLTFLLVCVVAVTSLGQWMDRLHHVRKLRGCLGPKCQCLLASRDLCHQQCHPEGGHGVQLAGMTVEVVVQAYIQECCAIRLDRPQLLRHD